MLYDNYVWRLTAPAVSADIELPQDLEWIDEATWTPVKQNILNTLTGSLVVQEYTYADGRPITLVGKEDMGWISRGTLDQLLTVYQRASIPMKLEYLLKTSSGYGSVLKSFDVLFRHADHPALDVESVQRFDNFEPTAFFKIKGLKFVTAKNADIAPCSSNVTLVLTNIAGDFSVGDTITGDTSGVVGTVVAFNSPALFVQTAEASQPFVVGEVVRADSSNYATIDSIQ